MPIVKYENRSLRFPEGMTDQEMETAILALPKEERASPTLDRLKAKKALEGKPPLIVDEVRREALERQYGYIATDPFSVRTMVGNIPQNIEEIVASIGSLIAGSAIFAYKFGKNFHDDVNEFASEPKSTDYSNVLPRVKEQLEPMTDLGRAIYYDWKAMFAGEVSDEIGKLPAGQVRDAIWDKVERQGLGTTLKYFIQDHPVDASLLANVFYRAIAAGTRVTAKTAARVDKIISKDLPIAGVMEKILSTKRTPIVYNVGKTPKGEPLVVTFERAYSKDPLTKYLFQESFDAVLDKFPKMGAGLAEHKAKKLINNLRNAYEDATFEERSLMHKEIFQRLDTLTKEEQRIIVPYLEGRAALIREPSDQFKTFEDWYRTIVDSVQRDLIERRRLTPEVITARMYQPLAKATGQNVEQVVAELGEFKPIYVHHTFPKIFEDKTGIHFAETTGQRYKPSFLKRAKGREGYSENLAEVLPKWSSEYIKFKNTEAFLKEFTTKFGVRVNIRDVKPVEGGLQVGDVIYPNHKIVAPDGYLQFYRGKIDFYKEVSRRMEHSTFDEAIGEALEGMVKEYVGVGKNQTVYLVPKELVKELETFAYPFFGSRKAQDAVRLVVDRPTQIWKDMVLAGSPRWIKNNVMGDIIFNSMEKVGPLSYSRAFRSIYKDTIPDELLKASFANIMKYNPKLGKTAETTMGQLITQLEATKAVKGIAKAKDLGYSINTMFEQPFVRALYVNLARKKAVSMLKAEGLSRSEVNILNKMRVIKMDPELSSPLIAKVKETLPVFNLIGSWERKYFRRLAPFVNWYKFMVKYAAKLPVKHPFLTVGGRGLGELSEHHREEAFKMYFPFMVREIEENGIPQRLDNLWPVGEIGKDKVAFFNTRGLNPFATIEDVANLDLLPMMSPVVTVPYEQITGRAAFGDREFRSGEEGIYVTTDGKVEFRDFTKVRPPLWDHILSQLPQYTVAKQLLVPAKQFDTGTILNPDPIMDPVTGEYKYPIESIEKMFNFMGIDKRTLDVREVWDAFLKRKRTALGRAVTKGVSKDMLSFEDIRQVFKEMVKDKPLMKKIKGEMKLEQEEKVKETKELLKKIKEEKASE